MPRAADAFRAVGFEVLPSVTDIRATDAPSSWRDWIPDAAALEATTDVGQRPGQPATAIDRVVTAEGVWDAYIQLPVKEGILVQSVDPNSAAAKAGIKGGSQQQQQAGARQLAAGGDIIVAVDGKAVKRPEDFASYLELNKKAGETVALTIVRDGQQRDVTVTLGERPAAQQQAPSFPFPIPGR